jgi:hypothetical protein
MQPGRPMAPPMKKMRAGSTPNKVDDRVDDAIARRRAQLQLLQQQKNQSSVLNQARSTFQPSGPPPTTLPSAGAPPIIPQRSGTIARVRESDLFPTVPKAAQPPPPALARRLEPTFTATSSGKEPPQPPTARTRSKSAPPSRPKPPPPRPAGSKERGVGARPPPAPASLPHSLPGSPNGKRSEPRAPPMPGSAPPMGLSSAPLTPVDTFVTMTPTEEEKRVEFSGKDVAHTPPVLDNAQGHTPFSKGDKMAAGHTPFPKGEQENRVEFSERNDVAHTQAWGNVQGHTPFSKGDKMAAGHTPFPKGEQENRVEFSENNDVAHTQAWGNVQGHTPFSKGDKKAAGHTPFPKGEQENRVEFSEKNDVAHTPPVLGNAQGHTPFPKGNREAAGHTPFPNGDREAAGHTPFPKSDKVATPESGTTPHTLFPGGHTLSPGNAGQTPFPGKTNATRSMIPAPSTTKKDLLKNMRQVADSLPSPELAQSPEMRIAKEVILLEKDKTDALTQVAKLQDEVQKLQMESPLAGGDNANKKVGFLSPPKHARSPRRKHISTPHPKRSQTVTLTPDEERALLVQATRQTVHEYVSEIATFTVRRPYGVATERDFWFAAGQLNKKMYEKQADASQAETLEVVANVNCDGSLLVLYGEAMIRHQQNKAEDWKEYGNAEDNPLGYVLYIDSEANELDYCLDDIFQGAKAVREHYSAAVVSMQSALERDGAKTIPGTPQAASPMAVPAVKVPTKETGVGTEDVPKAMPAQVDEKPAKKKKKSKDPPPEEPSPGALVAAIGMFVNLISELIWFFFIRLPLRIVSTTIVMACAIFILATIQLYLADDRGAQAMGAAVYGSMYNQPGIV